MAFRDYAPERIPTITTNPELSAKLFRDSYPVAAQQQPEITPTAMANILRATRNFNQNSPEFGVFQTACAQHFRGNTLDARRQALEQWLQAVNNQLGQQHPPMRISLEPLTPAQQRAVEETCRREGRAVPPFLRQIRLFRNNEPVGPGGIIGLVARGGTTTLRDPLIP
jgi:hypothetical protein